VKAVDETVLITFLTNNPPQEAVKCERLFARAARKEEQIFIPFVVLWKLAGVLEERVAKKDEIIALFRDLFALKGVTVGSAKFTKQVFSVYESTDLAFSESVLVGAIQEKGLTQLYTYSDNSLNDHLKIIKPE